MTKKINNIHHDITDTKLMGIKAFNKIKTSINNLTYGDIKLPTIKVDMNEKALKTVSIIAITFSILTVIVGIIIITVVIKKKCQKSGERKIKEKIRKRDESGELFTLV